MTNLISGRALNFRTARIAAVTAATVAASLGALLPDAAQAQTYIGNAYTAKAGASSFLGANALIAGLFSNVGANASVFDTGFLNNSTKEARNALGASANVDLSLATSSLLATAGLGNLVDATVQTSQTSSVFTPINAGDTAVLSTARVVGLDLGNSLNITGLALANALVSADAVQSQTTAFLSGSTTGITILTDFSLNGLTAAQLGIVGTTDLNGNLVVTQQQTITVYDNFLLGGVGQGTQIGTLTINELIPNSVALGALTTNALHLRLNSSLGALGTALGSLAGADVIISSSTAGFTPAAPEPGSLALLAVGLLPAAGLLRRRRLSKK